MPRFRVTEIVPVKIYYSKVIEAESAEAALAFAREHYSDIEQEEKEETGDIIGDVDYEVEAIAE